MESDPVEWDASEYDQKNPLYTDEDGCYSWDVPEGLWQVKFEMNGYETTYSEWLPVPPPQLDVNIGLISTALPQIAYVNVYNDEIELVFTQFMNIDSVINGNVQFKHNGQILEGLWNPQAVQKTCDSSPSHSTAIYPFHSAHLSGTDWKWPNHAATEPA